MRTKLPNCWLRLPKNGGSLKTIGLSKTDASGRLMLSGCLKGHNTHITQGKQNDTDFSVYVPACRSRRAACRPLPPPLRLKAACPQRLRPAVAIALAAARQKASPADRVNESATNTAFP